MQIVIEISNKDIPKHQEIIDVRLHFIDGHIVDADGYGFAELPKGHGRLIDADTLEGHSQIQIVPCGNGKYVEVMTYYQNDIDVATTIIEADKED